MKETKGMKGSGGSEAAARRVKGNSRRLQRPR
jgi:hypothetical protein